MQSFLPSLREGQFGIGRSRPAGPQETTANAERQLASAILPPEQREEFVQAMENARRELAQNSSMTSEQVFCCMLP